jgi:hypothetical protein
VLKLDNLRTDHVMIRSELKYLIGANIVDLKCRVFGGKTAPFPTVRVFRVVRPVATVRCRVEPNPEPTREFGPVSNTSCTRGLIMHDGRHGHRLVLSTDRSFYDSYDITQVNCVSIFHH